jgi:hypothetical protein
VFEQCIYWQMICQYQSKLIVQDEELARQLVELGYRGSGEVIKREEFYTRKAAAEQLLLSRRIQAP